MFGEERCNWLKTLKVGDKVVSRKNRIITVLTITKITPTRRMTTSDNSKWNNSGVLMGSDTWHTVIIDKYDEEEVKKAKEVSKRRILIDRINNSDLRKLSTQDLEKIANKIGVEIPEL